MEQKTVIIINNEKEFHAKGKIQLNDIKNFIKKVYNIPKESYIDLYDKNYSKILYFVKDLEKLKEKNEQQNIYLIKLNFRIKEIQQPDLSKTQVLSSNTINRLYEAPKIASNKKVNDPKRISQKIKLNPNIKKININKIDELKKNDNSAIIEKKDNDPENLQKSYELKNILQKAVSQQVIQEGKINEELKQYKKKQEEDIKSLENELNQLKRKNEEIQNKNDNINNIVLNNNMIETLKTDIINKIDLKIDGKFEEIIKVLDNIKEKEEININKYKKYVDIRVEEMKNNINNDINKKIEQINNKFGEFENKFNDLNAKFKEKEDLLVQNRVQNQRTVLRDKNTQLKKDSKNLGSSNNIKKIDINAENDKKVNRFINMNSKDYNKKKSNNIINDQENISDEDEVNLNNSNKKIKDMNIFNKQKQNADKIKINNMDEVKNSSYFDNISKEKPKQIQNQKILEQNKYNNPIQKKKSLDINLLSLLNNIFFKNVQQTEINTNKVNEHHLETIKKAYFKHINDEQNYVYDYINNFIKVNVLKLFKKNNIPKEDLEIVKYNIASLLGCIGMNKEFYSPYYFPELKKGLKGNRQASVEAAARFRKEYCIPKDEINEDVLINTLYENGNDINQTFQIIFGK